MTATREVQLNLLDGEIIDGAVRQPRHEPRGWIMPSVFQGTNAELIAAVAPMYLTDGLVVDTTSGLAVHDLIIHHTGSGPGGHNIFTPVRARRHHSYLVVFRRNTSPHLLDPPEDAA